MIEFTKISNSGNNFAFGVQKKQQENPVVFERSSTFKTNETSNNEKSSFYTSFLKAGKSDKTNVFGLQSNSEKRFAAIGNSNNVSSSNVAGGFAFARNFNAAGSNSFFTSNGLQKSSSEMVENSLAFLSELARNNQKDLLLSQDEFDKLQSVKSTFRYQSQDATSRRLFAVDSDVYYKKARKEITAYLIENRQEAERLDKESTREFWDEDESAKRVFEIATRDFDERYMRPAVFTERAKEIVNEAWSDFQLGRRGKIPDAVENSKSTLSGFFERFAKGETRDSILD